jgi:hypothetical protein
LRCAPVDAQNSKLDHIAGHARHNAQRDQTTTRASDEWAPIVYRFSEARLRKPEGAM